MNDRQIVLRVPEDTMDRAEKLARSLAKQPEYAGMRMTPSAVLRLALLRGLEQLESRRGR